MSLLLTNDEYNKALDILYKSCPADSQKITTEVKNYVFSKLPIKNNLLDIGAGTAEVTRCFSPYFNSTTVIEKNENYAEIYARLGFSYIIGDFLEHEFQQTFDLIICSHVLYHISKGQLNAFLDKVLSLLNKGGFLIIQLIAPRGDGHKFHSEINVNYMNSGKIVALLDEKKISYSIISSRNLFEVSSLSDMCVLAKLFVLVDCLSCKSEVFTPEKISLYEQKAIAYAKKLECNKSFVCIQEEDSIIINKTS